MFFYVDIPYYAYHFTVSGHLDFFHILAAFLNNAARNHGVQISLEICFTVSCFFSLFVYLFGLQCMLCAVFL